MTQADMSRSEQSFRLFDIAAKIIQAEIATWDVLELALREAGCSISVGRYLFLNAIYEGDRRVSDIAERGGLSIPAVSRLCDRMLRDGLLDKKPNPDDKRSYFFVLTHDGEKEYKKASMVLEESCGQIFSFCDRQCQAKLLEDLGEYVNRTRLLKSQEGIGSPSRFS